MRAIAVLALAALLAPAAAAQDPAVHTPLGDGALLLDLGGSPPAVVHDPGREPLPGDDTLVVHQGVDEARLTWDGAPVGLAADAGLRGLRVRQDAVAAVDAALESLAADVPPGLLVAWPWLGPEGFDVDMHLLGYDRAGGEAPLTWQAMMLGQPWGPSYDAVALPAAFDGSSDAFVADRLETVSLLCDRVQRDLQVALGACADAAAAAYAALPAVGFHTESPTLAATLQPATFADLLGSTPLLGEALAGALGTAGAEAGHDEPLRLDRLLVDLAASAGVAEAPGVPRPAAPGASAQHAGVVPLATPGTLPLAVAALALPLLGWALYRRILPSRALHHPVREDLLRRVRAHPGIHESMLAREMGLRHTHVQYHIRVLEEAGVLETRRFGGLKCIFELGRHSPSEKAFAMADRGRTREVLVTVGQQPGIAQRELARTLAMSESSVKWHLDRLEQAGMVRTERARGAKRAWPVPGGLQAPAPPAVALPAAPPVVAVPAAAPPAPL